EVGVVVQERAVGLGDTGEVPDHRGRQRATQLADQVGRLLRRHRVGELGAHLVDERLDGADTRRAQHRLEDLADPGGAGRVRSPPDARSSRAPSAGFEPAHTAPEADALSPELRGRDLENTRQKTYACWCSTTSVGGLKTFSRRSGPCSAVLTLPIPCAGAAE